MSDTTETKELSVDDILDMSDEEFIKSSEESAFPSEESKPEPEEEEETGDQEDEVESSDESSEEEEVIELEDDSEPESEAEEPDYKSFYEKVSEALGGAENRTAEEIASLIRKGESYDASAESIARNNAQLRMLQKHGLSDISSLALAIDAYKGNPRALRELIKQRNFDTSELYYEDSSPYKPDESITDSRLTIQEAVDMVAAASADGAEFLSVIRNQWDKESNAALLNNPELLCSLDEQRRTPNPLNPAESAYTCVMNEVQKRVNNGSIPRGTPLISAYLTVNGEMREELLRRQKNTNRNQENSNRVKSASLTRSNNHGSSRRKGITREDILDMSDEKFLEFSSKYL